VSPFLPIIDSETTSVKTAYVGPITSAPILGMQAPRIRVKIEHKALPVLLDTGKDLTVMSKQQMDMLVAPLDTEKPKYVSGFAGSKVTLTGPRYLKLHICGVTIVHPFYALDHDTPIIIGFNALTAARIIIDTYGRRAYSQFNHIGTSSHSDQRTVLASPSPPVIFGEHPRMSPAFSNAASADAVLSSTFNGPCGLDGEALCPASATERLMGSNLLTTDHVSSSSCMLQPVDNSASDSDPVPDLPAHLKVLYISTLEHGDITNDYAPALKQLLLTHADTFAKS